MEKKLFVMALAFVFVLSACEKQLSGPYFEDDLSILDAASEKSAMNEKGQAVLNFRAHLTGDQEIPARETQATGQALFQLSKDGTELRYKLIVSNLDSITMAHIHIGALGANGGFVVWLYPSSGPALLIPEKVHGTLREGVIKKENLVGAYSGKELSDLISIMASGNTYVNIHTSRFPGGEIRGQIYGNVK